MPLQSTHHDFFKNESIILQTIYNHPKKAIASGLLLTVMGLSLGHSDTKNITWTQEGLAYGLIATGAILTKTGYTSLNNYTIKDDIAVQSR